MTETYEDQLSRVRMMSTPAPANTATTWDLSPNDQAALRAVLDALPQWQPIETAPKDGTDFLACWDDDELHVVCLRGNECFRAMDREEWAIPTVWMPLPAPPELKDAARRTER